MASCGDQGCNCLVSAGPGIEVTGAGTAKSPYRVGLSGDLSGNFTVTDTESINFSLFGSGTSADPYNLSATATVRLTQLADVSDPQGGPNVGDVPVWIGSGAVGHWEFQPPPANPPGAVNVGPGIDGDGSVGAPIEVSVIGTSSGGATSGLEVYVDSAGNLRAVPPVASAVTWTSITGKPDFFPTNDSTFNGVLSATHGGTGQNSLSLVTVGNASKISNHAVFVQSGTPTALALDDLWFY